MIKALVLCTFLAFAFATRNWAGNWMVADQRSSDLTACDVPAFYSIVNITANGSNLILEGISADVNTPKTWTLDWSDEEQGYSYCSSDDWCVAGYLIYQDGNTFANITWHLSDLPTTWCSSLLSPATLNWVGRWLVWESQPAANCPVPTTFVNINASGDHLLMVDDSGAKLPITWTLNFTAQEQHVDKACIERSNSCVKAELAFIGPDIIESEIFGNLSWVIDNSYVCNATLTKLPPHFRKNLTLNNLDYQEVPSMQSESLIA